jgi:glutamine synthetase
MVPHYVLSAIFLLGLRGIARQSKLPCEPIGVLQARPGGKESVVKLASNLEAATRTMMREGSLAREILGDAFVDHYGGTREHEVAVWNEAVTNWEGEDIGQDLYTATNLGYSEVERYLELA